MIVACMMAITLQDGPEYACTSPVHTVRSFPALRNTGYGARVNVAMLLGKLF
jgi:hypothetical protein